MLIVIDNYDSFTYNLVQYLGELGAPSQVYRNDEISVEEVRAQNPQAVILSPGPCTPDKAGISMAIIAELAPSFPIFGVCLGMQSMAQVYGGRIVRAQRVMHGKQAEVRHNEEGLFRGIPNPFSAARYHSLIADDKSLPDCFIVTAWTENNRGERGEIMGLKHKQFPLVGVQFHPESILTNAGKQLLTNFLNLFVTTEKHYAS